MSKNCKTIANGLTFLALGAPELRKMFVLLNTVYISGHPSVMVICTTEKTQTKSHHAEREMGLRRSTLLRRRLLCSLMVSESTTCWNTCRIRRGICCSEYLW